MSSNVKIEIAAEYTGKPAFLQATKNVSALEKSVKSLGKSFAAIFVTGKIATFARDAAKAFAEDQKSAALLSNTVKNLGLSLSSLELEKFVQKLQSTSGVLDQELRPALQKLLTTTGSIVKSEELLAQAIDISRGSGQDLATVVADLSNAYVGNTRGLRKYALGLTQAELKAASFADIQAKLNKQFSGSSAAYLDTYAGKLDLLNTAADNAKETIGAGLFDAFAAIGGGKDVQDAIKNIDTIANGLANIVRLGGQVVGVFTSLYKAIDYIGTLGGLLGTNGTLFGGKGKTSTNRSSSPAGSWAKTQQQKAAEAAATKRAQELAKATTKQTAELKKQALAKKQSALFDMEQIQLIAALKGKLSEEDRNRVLLQLALLQGNEEAAAKLSTQVANAIDKTGNLAKYLQTLPDANNPFKNWDAYLQGIIEKMKSISGGAGGTGSGGNTQVSPTTPIDPINPPDFSKYGWEGLLPNIASGSFGGMGGNISDASGFAGVIKVVVDGKEIASTLQNQSLSGNNTTVDRLYGSFAV